VPASALGLALLAAALHAGWNLVLGSARDVRAATAVALGLSVVLLAPWAGLTWSVGATALPWIAASAALELAYFALLVSAYSRSDVSLVYPIARGSAPVLVLLGALLAGVTVGGWAAVGVLLVGAGVLLVRGVGGPIDGRGVALAVAIGATIAGYTLVDDEGVEHAGVAPYLLLVLLPVAVVVLTVEVASGRALALRSALGPSTVAAAVASVLAYALVLAALELAAPAPVAAVRESSVVVVAIVGTAFLGESGGRARVAGALLVLAGIALIGLA
jgi:drug/metabolite transporter (DMT)-like permease